MAAGVISVKCNILVLGENYILKYKLRINYKLRNKARIFLFALHTQVWRISPFSVVNVKSSTWIIVCSTVVVSKCICTDISQNKNWNYNNINIIPGLILRSPFIQWTLIIIAMTIVYCHHNYYCDEINDITKCITVFNDSFQNSITHVCQIQVNFAFIQL